MTHCPLCLVDENEREADHEYDGVKVCTYHALAAQTGDDGIRERIAALKGPARPMQLVALIQVPGAVDLFPPDTTPPRGKVVMCGSSSANATLYADGVELGRVTGIDAVAREHFYVDGIVKETHVTRTDVEIVLDIDRFVSWESVLDIGRFAS